MSVDTFVARMQSRQAELFDSTGTLTRDGGKGTFNSTTSSYQGGLPQTVFTGDVLIRPDSGSTVNVGDTSLQISAYLVKFPADTDVHIGDLFTVSASVHDAGLVGQVLRVLDVTNDEWQISRRTRCVVQNPRPT